MSVSCGSASANLRSRTGQPDGSPPRHSRPDVGDHHDPHSAGPARISTIRGSSGARDWNNRCSFTPRMSLSRRWRRFSSTDSSGYTEPQGDEAVATHGSDELVRTSHGRSLQRDAERQRHVDARLVHRAQQARHLAVVPELHPRGGLLLHGGGDVVGPDVRMRSMITGCSRPPGPGRASWRASRG